MKHLNLNQSQKTHQYRFNFIHNDETFCMISKFPQSKYIENDRSGFFLRVFVSSKSYENVIQKHKKSSKRPNNFSKRPNVDFSKISKIGQIFLNMTKFRPRKKVFLANLNKSHRMKKKRIRFSSSRYVNSVNAV